MAKSVGSSVGIREKADFDIDRILEIEQQTRHAPPTPPLMLVAAFTRAVSETLGEERKWVHYGYGGTSTDVGRYCLWLPLQTSQRYYPQGS